MYCQEKFEISDSPHTLKADIRGEQEEPPVVTRGHGTGTFYLSGDHLDLEYEIKVRKLSSPLTAAHFHRAPVGQNGPVVKTIQFCQKGNYWVARGIWSIDEKQEEPLDSRNVALLLVGGLYINVHTEKYPAGEIRGQIFVHSHDHSDRITRVARRGCDSFYERGDTYGYD